MNNFKVILSESLQGEETVSVVTAHSLSLNFNHYGPVGNASNDLSDGNFGISGKQSLLLADGTIKETDLPSFNIRLKELQNLIPTLEGQAKTDAEAKFAIWNTCLGSIQEAITAAMQAQYQHDNG